MSFAGLFTNQSSAPTPANPTPPITPASPASQTGTFSGLFADQNATPATPSNSAPQSTPSYFSGKGYSPSPQLDMPGAKSANNAPLGKPLLTVPMKIEKTFMSPETTVPILDSTRVATTFDPTVAQKITPDMLQNGRMPTSVSGTLRDKLGATAFQELDHIMPLELGGSNQTNNSRLESAKNSTIPYNPGSNPTPTDPLENALAEKVHNGDISLVDAWRKMAQAKGITLTEDRALNSPINNFLLNTPDVLEPLANLQTGIQDVFKDIGGHLANIPQDLIDPAINAWKGLDTAVKEAAVTPTKTGAEKVKSILDFVSASANAVFTPITTAFNVLKDVPVVGAVSKMITLPFQIAGTGGEILSKEALDALPISDTAKNTLKESVGQIGSLAAQIALGYGIKKVSALSAMKDTATKVADMKTSGEEVTPKITQDLLKENLDKAKSEIPTKNQKTTASPVKPSETNISPELQPLAEESRKGLNYDNLLNEKIKLQAKIQKLEPTVSETDFVTNTTKAKQLRSLKTELSFTEDAMGKIRQETPAISKDLSPLAVEARKYKSAEEFVKAQGETLYRASPELPTTGNFKKGTYFADSEQAARYYSESHLPPGGDPSSIKVERFVVPKDAVFREPSTGNTVIKSDVPVQTKSQLTNFYNQATKGETVTPSENTKSAGIGKSIEAKAVEDKLTQGFKDTAQYETINIKDQAKKATDLINNNVDNARAIIRGEAPLPEGLKGTALITAMEEHIKNTKDANLAYELANSPLVTETSKAAQEMRLAAERQPDSATAKIIELRKSREAQAEKGSKTTTSDLTRQMKKEMGQVNLPKAELSWNKFLDEIIC